MAVVGLSHPRAATTVPDPVHGAIELTIFDRDIVDSKSFQRLHFVLQQSVNYVSFPANKNTRFPHSLGTAHLAGRMFSRALSNSDTIVLREFLKIAGDFLAELIGYLYPPSKGLGPLKGPSSEEEKLKRLLLAHRSTISGMSRFLHSPLSLDMSSRDNKAKLSWRVDTTDMLNSKGNLPTSFVIDTYWQALRIYALAHDIGHLPMSHAFEKAIDRVSDGISDLEFPGPNSSQFKTEREKIKENFGKLLDSTKNNFFGLNGDEEGSTLFQMMKSLLDIERDTVIELVRNKPLHEVRGYAILNIMLTSGSEISDHFLDIPSEFDSSKPNEVDKKSLNLYCNVIHSLALCIMYSLGLISKRMEKVSSSNRLFLYAIRQLVDGTIDGDRLDYTLRDCNEAGARFGDFDLEAIVRNSLLVSHRVNESGDPQSSSLFAFGYGPRAISGIEQFFEARYQSYKYLVHHRTASRSNTAVEALIEKLFVFAALAPASPCAIVLERYSYIKRTKANILEKILPVMTDNIWKIDDCSLRTLLHEVNDVFDGGYIVELVQDFGRYSPHVLLAKEIRTLSEVVLFRDLHHIVTLFKLETVESFFLDKLGLVDTAKDSEGRTECDRFTDHVQANLGEMISECRRSVSAMFLAGNWEQPVTLLFEDIRSKAFRVSPSKDERFEKCIWIRDSRNNLSALEDGKISPGLKAMSDSYGSERRIRLYAVSHELKTRPDAVRTMERIIVDCLMGWLEAFRRLNA